MPMPTAPPELTALTERIGLKSRMAYGSPAMHRNAYEEENPYHNRLRNGDPLTAFDGLFTDRRSCSRISGNCNVSAVYCTPYYECGMVAKSVQRKVFPRPHCDDGDKFALGDYHGRTTGHLF